MHEMSVFWLRAATVLYSVGLLQTIQTVLRRKAQMFPGVLAVFSVAVVLHGVSLVESTFELGHFPANNFYETISLCGFTTAILFLFVYWRYEFRGLSVVLFPLIFLMTFLGAMQFPVATWSNRSTRDAWLIVHVISVVLGYAALLLTSVAAMFYLLQERQLKSKRPGTFFEHLPALGTLDNLISRSMDMSFVLLTVGVLTGASWSYLESGLVPGLAATRTWLSDPRLGSALFTWLFCLIMVFLRISAGWRGRKTALMAIAVLGCSVATWAAHLVVH